MTTETAITTNEVRLSFVNLFTPRSNQPGQEAKYSTTILIPKSDFATMQRINAAIEAASQKGVAGAWGGARPAQPRNPIHDGDGVRPNGEAFGPECKGHWVLTASSKQQQAVVGPDMGPIIDQTRVYSGVYGRVNINFFAYSNSGNKGIGAGLGPVQILRDGEPLGGRISAEQAFGGNGGGVGYVPQPAPQGYDQIPPQQYGQQPPQQPQYGQTSDSTGIWASTTTTTIRPTAAITTWLRSSTSATAVRTSSATRLRTAATTATADRSDYRQASWWRDLRDLIHRHFSRGVLRNPFTLPERRKPTT
ncbi:DUF2815 family protein [Paenibacillus amylolyticus]|nr:DUF2815 family protein [Paenibacillus amylolyticus]WFR60839.1 DUF2815 family protein [Paenibacillus amylolyticus]